MMNNICPVCNKAGLPDYRATPTICPQCNSDLKPFFLLNSISKPTPSKAYRFALLGVALVAGVVGILYFSSVIKQKQIISENSNKTSQLQDSINNLQTTFAKLQINQFENKSPEKEIIIQYKVKNGDNPSKIAYFFYNDWRMYKKLEADNNLTQPYILKVGQLLTIKPVKK